MASVVLTAHADAVDWISLQSNNVAAVAYSSAFKRMFVRFKSGARYAYFDVPETVYEGLRDSSSPGSYLYNVIRNGGLDDLYGYEKL